MLFTDRILMRNLNTLFKSILAVKFLDSNKNERLIIKEIKDEIKHLIQTEGDFTNLEALLPPKLFGISCMCNSAEFQKRLQRAADRKQ